MSHEFVVGGWIVKSVCPVVWLLSLWAEWEGERVSNRDRAWKGGRHAMHWTTTSLYLGDGDCCYSAKLLSFNQPQKLDRSLKQKFDSILWTGKRSLLWDNFESWVVFWCLVFVLWALSCVQKGVCRVKKKSSVGKWDEGTAQWESSSKLGPCMQSMCC